MTYTTAIFYFFAAILVFAGLRVITARNPVHAALFLVLAFFTAAGLWMLLEAEFLAITLVLVYVGAVMVLFLFVVMMLDINLDKLREGFWDYLPIAGFVSVLLMIEMALILGSRHFGLDVMATFTAAANANNKTVRLRIGGLAGTVVAEILNDNTSGNKLQLRAVLLVDGASSVSGMAFNTRVTGATSLIAAVVTGLTLSSTIDVVATGLTATAAADITLTSMRVALLRRVP